MTRTRNLLLLVLPCLVLGAGCGRKSGGLGDAGGTGGSSAGPTGTASSTTSASTTGTVTTTSTSTTGTSTSTSTSTSTTGTSSTTACDLPGGTGWNPGATGTGTAGWTDYQGPYHPCQTDEDCADGNNLDACVAARCLKVDGVGSICRPVGEYCVTPGAVICPDSGRGWPDCSPEDVADPLFDYCAYPDGPIDCYEINSTTLCFIICDPPKVPCPEGMICHIYQGSRTGRCLWP